MLGTYSLNLSPRYAPNWGAWEVAREIISNAIDADPDGMSIVCNGIDELVVKTNTVPNLSELFIIGEGSKAPGGETIGQFGEGLKMAALAATRAHGSISLNLPGKSVAFRFDQVMGADVLHAHIEANPLHDEGYEATIRMTGVGIAFAGRILPDRKAGPLNKATADTMRLYIKGVFICDYKVRSIWDWNLDDCELNRDRSMVDNYKAVSAVRSWLAKGIDPEMARAIVGSLESWESTQVLEYNYHDSIDNALTTAFRAMHGPLAVVASIQDNANDAARMAGFIPVHVSEGVAKSLGKKGVKSADDVRKKSDDLERVDSEKYAGQIAKLRTLDSIIAAPQFSVAVFADRSEAHKGLAELDEYRIWLNEGLFTPGNELELTRTYLHEVGHLMSGANDATTAFEHALDGIAGRLAMAVQP